MGVKVWRDQVVVGGCMAGDQGAVCPIVAASVPMRRLPAPHDGLMQPRDLVLLPAVSPALQLVERALQAAALFGQGVLDANRCLGVDPALDDAARFQLLQALGQHARTQAADHVFDLAEAARAGEQDAQDEARPALADDVDSPLVARAQRVTALIAHGRVASVPYGRIVARKGPNLGHPPLKHSRHGCRRPSGPSRERAILATVKVRGRWAMAYELQDFVADLRAALSKDAPQEARLEEGAAALQRLLVNPDALAPYRWVLEKGRGPW